MLQTGKTHDGVFVPMVFRRSPLLAGGAGAALVVANPPPPPGTPFTTLGAEGPKRLGPKAPGSTQNYSPPSGKTGAKNPPIVGSPWKAKKRCSPWVF